MAITPISSTTAQMLQALNNTQNTSSSSGTSFESIFQDAIAQVNQTDQITKVDTINLATGNADDLHTIMINSEKANLALQMLVQMRNKALDAYSEIMRITL